MSTGARLAISTSVAILLVLASVNALASVPPPLVIHGDYKLGGFAVKRDGSLAGAIKTFGQPSSSRHVANRRGCAVRWKPLGLRIFFYNLGGRDACVPAHGRFATALVTGRAWRTAKGLKIGDSRTRLIRLHKPSRRVGSWWWIVIRRAVFGEDGPYPGLETKVHRGRVSAFRVTYPAGGD